MRPARLVTKRVCRRTTAEVLSRTDNIARGSTLGRRRRRGSTSASLTIRAASGCTVNRDAIIPACNKIRNSTRVSCFESHPD